MASIKNRILQFTENARAVDPDLDLNVQFTMSFEPFITNVTTKFAKSVQKAVTSVYREEREFKLFQSANDGHFFHEKGIETILMGTGSHECNVHAADEFVYIRDLLDTTIIFALTIFNYLAKE